jgi:hypothetical protein
MLSLLSQILSRLYVRTVFESSLWKAYVGPRACAVYIRFANGFLLRLCLGSRSTADPGGSKETKEKSYALLPVRRFYRALVCGFLIERDGSKTCWDLAMGWGVGVHLPRRGFAMMTLDLPCPALLNGYQSKYSLLYNIINLHKVSSRASNKSPMAKMTFPKSEEQDSQRQKLNTLEAMTPEYSFRANLSRRL